MWLAVALGCHGSPAGDASALPPSRSQQQEGDTSEPSSDDTGDTYDTAPTTTTWYADSDGDGHGDPDDSLEAEAPPEGYVATGDDCDDADEEVHPGAEERCNRSDDDCDGEVDEGFTERCRISGTLDLVNADQKLVGSDSWDAIGLTSVCGGDTNGDGQPELLVNESNDYDGSRAGGGAWLVVAPGTGTSVVDDEGIALWGTADLSAGNPRFVSDLDGDGYDEVTLTTVGWPVLFAGPIAEERSVDEPDVLFTHDYSSINLGVFQSLDDSTVALAGGGNLYDDEYGWTADVGTVFLFRGPLEGEVSTHEAIGTLAPFPTHESASLGSPMCSGDFDGDGRADLGMASAPFSSATAYLEDGLVYLVYGPIEGDHQVVERDGSLADADARIDGTEDFDVLGRALSCGGDVDGDGLDDVLVGASSDGGHALLYYGPFEGEYQPEDAEWTLEPDGEGDSLGRDVTLDADLDGDGQADVVVGDDLSREGNLYLFYDVAAGVVNTDSADARVIPEDDGGIAASMEGCPDLDGDGQDDLLIGAPQDSSGGEHAGAAYLVLGGAAE